MCFPPAVYYIFNEIFLPDIYISPVQNLLMSGFDQHEDADCSKLSSLIFIFRFGGIYYCEHKLNITYINISYITDTYYAIIIILQCTYVHLVQFVIEYENKCGNIKKCDVVIYNTAVIYLLGWLSLCTYMVFQVHTITILSKSVNLEVLSRNARKELWCQILLKMF